MRRNFVSFQMKLSVMISLFTMLVAIVLSLIDYAQLKKTILTEKAVQYQLVEDRVIHAVKCGPRLVYSVFEQDMEGRMQRAGKAGEKLRAQPRRAELGLCGFARAVRDGFFRHQPNDQSGRFERHT